MPKGTEKNVKKRLLIVFIAIVFFLALVLGVLEIGVAYTKNSWDYWRPDYEQTNILPLLEKSSRTEEDYKTLYEQTGLTKIGVDDLLSEGKIEKILTIQANYFKPYTVTNDNFAPFTYMAEIDWFSTLANLQDGDILISATTFTSWFRYGHSALVVDGENQTVVESVSMGANSELALASEFTNRASYLVFRPKAEESLRKEVAAYAKENLVGIPYRITTGIFSKKYEETPTVSHCSHLVWYAYKKFGIDLDATGGLVVTPRDMAKSPHLELVQTFGFNPETLWR